MSTLIIFGLLSLVIMAVTRRTLFNVHSHGFYRFMAWECMAWLLATNYKWWFVNPFSFTQIVSWILLFCSIYLVIAGAILLKTKGKSNQERRDEGLYAFEKTTELIESGIFHYIRHPLYASLIFLSWGIFFKQPRLVLLLITALATFFLYLTAKLEEKECIHYFGEKYTSYMKRTKMFVPHLF
jgi:protein-S-isoprenylcysteine O-methyltransferase Ste14